MTCAWRTRLPAALSAPSWGPLKGAELPARRSGSFKASFKVLCRLASPEEVPPVFLLECTFVLCCFWRSAGGFTLILGGWFGQGWGSRFFLGKVLVAELGLTLCHPMGCNCPQVPLSMKFFSRQEYWSGFHFLLQGIFGTQG